MKETVTKTTEIELGEAEIRDAIIFYLKTNKAIDGLDPKKIEFAFDTENVSVYIQGEIKITHCTITKTEKG